MESLVRKNDLKEIFELYKSFLLFLFKPKEIISFTKQNNDFVFFIKVISFFVINTSMFFLLFNYINTKQLIIKYIPLVVLIKCIIYIPLCFIPALFKGKDNFSITKIGILESLVVLSPLFYSATLIYLLFLVSEVYFFYFFVIFFSMIIILYISIYYPINISRNKKIISIIFTFITCLSINYLFYFAEEKLLTNNEPPMLDLIYKESIEKAPQVIEYRRYINEHQELINKLTQSYINSGDKEILELLNKQIDLIFLKKNDIVNFNNCIIFRRNKNELNITLEIINAYEQIKREIDLFEIIPKEFSEENAYNKKRLEELMKHQKQIENEVNNSNNSEKYEKEVMQIRETAEEIKLFVNNTIKTRKQLEINNISLTEINKKQDFINKKMDELIEQTDKTILYWKKRSKFLF